MATYSIVLPEDLDIALMYNMEVYNEGNVDKPIDMAAVLQQRINCYLQDMLQGLDAKIVCLLAILANIDPRALPDLIKTIASEATYIRWKSHFFTEIGVEPVEATGLNPSPILVPK